MARNITPLTQPVQQSSGLQPFTLPFDQMYKVIVDRQAKSDELSNAMSMLNTSFAGMTARLSPDQTYLKNKNEEFNKMVDELGSQDLTKIPDLKSRLLKFATDPKLSQIEQNNAQYDNMIKERQDLAKDYKFSADRWAPVQYNIDQYNADGQIKQFNPGTLLPYYDATSDIDKAFQQIKPYVTSELVKDDNGKYMYVNKITSVDSETASGLVMGGLNKQALDQLYSSYTYEGGSPQNQKGFNDYVLNTVLGVGAKYDQYSTEITNLTKINDNNKTKTEKDFSTANPSKSDQILAGYSFSKAPAFTINEYAFNPDINIERQLEQKTSDLLAANQKRAEVFGKTWEKVVDKDVDGNITVNYKNKKSGEIETAEALIELNQINATSNEIAYFDSNRYRIKEEALNEIKSTFDKPQVKELNAILEKSDSNLLKEAEEYVVGQMGTYEENTQSIIPLGGSMTGTSSSLQVSPMTRVEYEKNKDAAIDKYLLSKSYVYKQYNDLVQKKIKDNFIYETTFGDAIVFNVSDPDYKDLVFTINNDLDGWPIYDNSTGQKKENFSRELEDGQIFVPIGYRYNDSLKKITAYGQIRTLKDKKEWLPSSSKLDSGNWEKDDDNTQYYEIEIDSLHNSIMKTAFGQNAGSVENIMHVIEDGTKRNESKQMRIPIDVFNDEEGQNFRTDILIKDLGTGEYSATYYDKATKKYESTTGSKSQIAEGLINFTVDNYNQINQSVEANRQHVEQLVLNTFKDYPSNLQSEIVQAIGFETATNPKTKYTTKAENPDSGAIGYIQFMPDIVNGKKMDYKTINGIKVPMEKIKNAGPIESMNLVKGYLNDFKAGINTWSNKYGFGGIYLAIFHPDMLNMTPDTKLTNVLTDKEFEQNPSFKRYHTISDLLNTVQKNAGSFK